MTAFLLRFIIFSGLLYFAYLLFFSKMSFFKINRGILLLIPVVSLLIPLVAPLFEAPALLRAVPVFDLNEITVNGEMAGSETAAASNTSWYWILYYIGAAGILTSVILGFVKGWRILKKSVPAFENVHVSQEASGPFAFFKKIVIPASLLDSEKLDTIVSHENAHVEQHHGYDNLYYNLLSTVFWFNPFIHLLSREMRQTHECLADEAALAKTSKESYAQLLLNSVFGSEITFDAANRFFNSSLIKTRITMIYKTKTNRKMKGLYLALLPLLALMIIVSCQKTEEEVQASPAPEEKSEILGFAEADQPPLFPGCDENASKEEQLDCFQQGIIKHVQENFKYPEKTREAGVDGKVFVQFTINEAGDIESVDVPHWSFNEGGETKSTPEEDPETGEKKYKVELNPAAQEAIDYSKKFVKTFPKMSPAIVDGKKTAISFTLPIAFKKE